MSTGRKLNIKRKVYRGQIDYMYILLLIWFKMRMYSVREVECSDVGEKENQV